MKEITLNKLILTNWKGVRRLEIDFSDITTISGDNASGKSRIYDAFLWLISGKDQFDRKDFEIISIENGKTLERVNAEVEGLFTVNGNEISLQRIYAQKWQRKKGEQIERLTGHETLYYYNGDPVKAGEFKKIVDNLIDETLFKLITNPAYFLFAKEMSWQKQREYLFQMAGTISYEQIAASNPKFRVFLDSITGKSFDEHRRSINSKKKKLNEDLEEIAPRIDQTKKLMPELRDFEAIREELNDVETGIKSLENSIADKTAAIRQQYEEIQEKQNCINNYRLAQKELVFKAKELQQNEVFEKNKQRREYEESILQIQSSLTSKERQKTELEITLKGIERNIEATEANIEKLRNDWYTENGKAYQEKEGCLVCPVFGIECTDNQATKNHTEAQEKAKVEFFRAKEEKLASINKQGLNLANQLKEYKTELDGKQADLQQICTDIFSLKTNLAEFQKRFDETPLAEVSPVIPEKIEAWRSIEEKIKGLQLSIADYKPVDVADLQDEKKKLEQRRDYLKTELADEVLIAKYNKEIENLTGESGQIAQQIADLERDIFLMEEFSRVRIKECEKRVNSLFTLVNFQLFDTTIENRNDESKAFECCIARNKSGVPIAATNTAERINAGLDIINALCRFHGIKAPIFIDNRESVNNLLPTESQVINLVVLPRKYKCKKCGHTQNNDKACKNEGCNSTQFKNITPEGLQIEQQGVFKEALIN